MAVWERVEFIMLFQGFFRSTFELRLFVVAQEAGLFVDFKEHWD